MGDSNKGSDLFTPQNPNVSYVQIKVLDKIYDIDVNYLRDFTVERTDQDVGLFSFTLVDIYDMDLEQKLMALIAKAQTGKNISFQYGWCYGDAKSDWYNGHVEQYEPTFLANNNLSLSISGYILYDTLKTEVVSFKGMSHSEIVQQISEYMGWNIEALDQTDTFSEERTFVLSNVNPVDYIRQKIVPESTANGVPFRFYTDTLGKRTNVYFIRFDHNVVPKKSYNFYVYAGNYGSVLSFSPRYTGAELANTPGREAFFNKYNNQLCTHIAEDKEGSGKEEPELTVFGSTSPDRMPALIANKWFERNFGSYTAQLEIYGDPSLIPTDYINIIPMRPDGTIHHSGGTYYITKITDTISLGGFRTTLDLIKAEVVDAQGNRRTLPLEGCVTLEDKQ